MEARAFYVVEVAIGTIGGFLAIMLSPEHQAFIVYLTGMAMITALLLWPEKKDKTIPLEAIKFKALHPRIERCQEVIRDGDYYERIREISNLFRAFTSLDIPTPQGLLPGTGYGNYWHTLQTWKVFLEHISPLAEAEASAGNLEMARKIYKELLK